MKKKVSVLQLKPHREKAVKNHHHWVFSGAIKQRPDCTSGSIVPVVDASGLPLGSAFYSGKGSIVARMISFDQNDPYETIKNRIQQAFSLRKKLFPQRKITNAFRLINGEGDLLPGLVVDQYDDVLVLQSNHAGIDAIKNLIVEQLVDLIAPKFIWEKSTGKARQQEGLSDAEECLFGNLSAQDKSLITILENRHKFLVDPIKGQKTGFFLDHREMRQQVGAFSEGLRVLNACCYTGGFSVYAAAGGAKNVVSLDISESAIAIAKQNMALNGFEEDSNQFIIQDLFTYLREQDVLPFDLVVLDPPAFAKSKREVHQACRGYKDINRLVMKKVPKGTLLLTSSCSYHVDADLFQTVVFQAAVEANRTVKIIGRHRYASDHPINLCHPEGDYLKSLLLMLE